MGADEAGLRWLFGQTIIPQVALISVGSANTKGHPRPEVIRALKEAGARILCTQITPQCHDELKAYGQVSLNLNLRLHQALSPDSLQAKRSKHVACAGTIVADLLDGLVRFGIAAQHEALVRQKVKTPLCMSA